MLLCVRSCLHGRASWALLCSPGAHSGLALHLTLRELAGRATEEERGRKAATQKGLLEAGAAALMGMAAGLRRECMACMMSSSLHEGRGTVMS